jgi:hypothetical protein
LFELTIIIVVSLFSFQKLYLPALVLKEVRLHFLELAAWLELSYGTQVHLLFGNASLLSSVGLHQEDPLFALALQPIILKL